MMLHRKKFTYNFMKISDFVCIAFQAINAVIFPTQVTDQEAHVPYLPSLQPNKKPFRMAILHSSP